MIANHRRDYHRTAGKLNWCKLANLAPAHAGFTSTNPAKSGRIWKTEIWYHHNEFRENLTIST